MGELLVSLIALLYLNELLFKYIISGFSRWIAPPVSAELFMKLVFSIIYNVSINPLVVSIVSMYTAPPIYEFKFLNSELLIIKLSQLVQLIPAP